MLKTQAIVIKEVNYRDNDKMLTLFSPEHGRIDVLSRGCRKSTAKLLACSQLFVCGDFQISTSNNKNYLSGCEIAHSFFNLRSDFMKLFSAQVFLEVSGAFIVHEQQEKALYYLLINTLYALEKELNDPLYLMLFFMTKIAQVAGIEPNLSECTSCGEKEAYYFSVEHGGLVCDTCRIGVKGKMKRISAQEIRELKRILAMPTKSVREAYDYSVSEQLIQLMNDYLEIMSENHFKSYRIWCDMLKKQETL